MLSLYVQPLSAEAQKELEMNTNTQDQVLIGQLPYTLAEAEAVITEIDAIRSSMMYPSEEVKIALTSFDCDEEYNDMIETLGKLRNYYSMRCMCELKHANDGRFYTV